MFLYGLAGVLLLHLPYLGLVLGVSAVSIVLNFLGRENRDERALRLGRELIEAAAFNEKVLFLWGVLPLAPIAFLFERILSGQSPVPWLFWIVPFGALAAGCALLSVYRTALKRATDLAAARFGTGAAGLAAIAMAAALLFTLLGTLTNPEKLPLIRSNPVFLLSFKSVTGLFLFLALSFGLTGGFVLRTLGRPAGPDERDPEYRNYARSVGAGLARAAAVATPVPVVLDLISLPGTALSAEVFAAAIVVLLLAAAAFLILILAPEKQEGGRGARVSVLYVLMFLAALAGNRAAAANAFFGRAVPATPPAEAKVPEAARPAIAELAVVEKGKAVFEAVCAACHRFDSRVVGPPLNEVVPKYTGNVEKLKSFLRNPAKVDPGYPSMPRLGLSEEEIDAVARYLLTHVKGGG